jgi:hypothetical protein
VCAGERGRDAVEVGPERARHQRHAHHGAAGQLDVGHVAVVARLQHDHLVARPHDGQDAGDDGLGGAGGDGDLGPASYWWPYCAAILAATASRSAGTPVIGGYWLRPRVMASVTA